jgi:hypothetical protein
MELWEVDWQQPSSALCACVCVCACAHVHVPLCAFANLVATWNIGNYPDRTQNLGQAWWRQLHEKWRWEDHGLSPAQWKKLARPYLKKQAIEPDTEAHACNPSFSGGRDQEDQCSKPAQANSSWHPVLKKLITEKGWWSGSEWLKW